MASVTDAAGPVSSRHYRPVDEPRPLLVFLHGGMWLWGDLDTHDRLCRRIAAAAGVEVLAVDYRRAPEHPWPAAVDDAVAVVRHAAAHLAASVAIGGDSAGGCLAALTCLALRDAGDPDVLAAQILVCPNTDLTGAHRSMAEKATGFGLEAADVRWAAAQWVPDVARHRDGDVSPLHAGDLSGLPAAVVVTAEHDPLRDEGDAYAARLAAAGVLVTQRCEPGLPHGFVQGIAPQATAAFERLIADLRACLIGAHRPEDGSVQSSCS
ncbi:MAG: acetyl esterase [Solirubrobacteraceae bacterium]|jgi:acetyl esterase|nr:acetyl esterase [Solirubrobacteraceae bacterium]